MLKSAFDIDPRIWKGNAEFLKDSKNYVKTEGLHYNWQQVGIKEQLVDNNESITPTTDKGYLDKDTFFQEVFTKLEALEEKNQNPDYYKGVPHDLRSQIQSQDNLGEFLRIQKKAIKPLSDEVIFIKKYQYDNSNTSEVLRFGINKKSQKVEVLFKEFEKETDKSVSISSQINDLDLFTNINKIKITEYEHYITEMALSYLETLESGKCVLIDVFDRKNNDIHTSVLIKQGQNTLLLDPSNPSFSIFLKQIKKDLFVYTDKNKTIYTPIKDTVTGPESIQSRDCIDVAVKLAFAINNSNKEFSLLGDKIDTTKIGLNHSIESTTNCTKISGLFPKEVEKNVFRVKQSSNITESKKASVLLKIFEKVGDFFEAMEKDPISKKDVQKYNKLNLEYKENIKFETQKLAKDFYSDQQFVPDNYSAKIDEYSYKLKSFFKQDAELELLGVELENEFSYIDNYYGH